QEVWIAVMGVTGCGKSTFIQKATGDRKVSVHHGLRSHTRDVEVHSCRIGNIKVNLIDTPGFDDTSRSETEVLQTISAYLAKAYYSKVYLNGIIYIHSILQPRMGGSDLRSVGILERLVGEKNMNNVLLVTNNWDALGNSEVGETREKELHNTPEFWGNLIKMGAHTARHRGDSYQSAHQLIDVFLNPDMNGGTGGSMKLLLQHELVDKQMRLEQTTVGDFINARLYEGQKLLEKEIDDLRKRYQRTADGHGNGKASVEELESLLDEKKKGLRYVRKNAEILGKRVEEL
ncbi:P-loop containing nucleoside triphosphate hydrolase protein, partial [Peziza echinospora]